MSEPHSIEPATLAQIRAIPRGSGPLVICDIDEVVLHFIVHLEDYLAERGFSFITHRYQLAGNIAGPDGRLAADDIVKRLVQEFFDANAGNQKPIPGAAEALSSLSRLAEVVLLTNLPGPANKPVRQALLASHGISFPLITNRGPKGGAVAALAAGRRRPVVFIDDSPSNLRSVRATLADAILIQFIADQRFLDQAEPLDGLHLKTNDWRQTRAYIERLFDT